MPARDRYQDAVIKSLERDGWTDIDEQYKVIIGRRRLWIDIFATHRQRNTSILIEVKSFTNTSSPVEDLMEAVGKYSVYQMALGRLGISHTLFLAVPSHAYEGIFSEEFGQIVIEHFQLKLLVFSSDGMEGLQWLIS
jgi:Holliday junction resolvase-like predicted endonuclease